MAEPLPACPPLTTERLILREFEPGDWRATHAYESDPDSVRYMPFAPYTEQQSRDYIENNLESMRERPRRIFDLAVTQSADGVLIGRCGLQVLAPEFDEAKLWYMLHRDYRGRGLMLEAAQRMRDFAFETLGVRRIWTDIDPRNGPSVALVEKLGLRQEAHFIENVLIKGEWCDTLIHALLRREWAAGQT